MKKITLLLLSALSIMSVSATDFTPGNLVVTRVGDGSTTLTNSTALVSVCEFAPTGTGQSPINTFSVSGVTNNLTLGGKVISEGQLSLTQDGRYLTLVGYNVDADADVNNLCITGVSATNNGIMKITVTNGGSGYTTAPSVTINTNGSGGDGKATAFAVLSGTTVSAIYITTTGSNYGVSPAPTVTITAPTSGSTATATVDADRTSKGINYTTTGLVMTISDPNIVGGVRPTVGAQVASGAISNIYLNNSGTGYTQQPTISITHGTGTGAKQTVLINSAYPYWMGGGTIKRVVARIDKTGTVDRSTAFNYPEVYAGSIRNVASVDGSAFWVNGEKNAVNYVTFGGTTPTRIGNSYDGTTTNLVGVSSLNIFQDKLYGLYQYANLYRWETLPTTITKPTLTSIFNPNSKNIGFVFLDMDPLISWNSTGYDLLYIASTGGSVQGIAKYAWDGTSWIYLQRVSTSACFGIAAKLSGTNRLIYTLTGDGSTVNNSIVTFTDATARLDNATVVTATTLASSGANYGFRGVSFAPISVPDAPTAATATAGNGQASVAFTAPASNGGADITGYTVTASPGGSTGTGTASPITVSSLSNGTAYTFTVTATNSVGTSEASVASSAVTPHATNNNIAVSSATNISALTLTPVSDVVVDNDALLTINQTTSINSLSVAAGGMVTNTSTLTTPTLTLNSDATNGTATYINEGTSNVTTLIANQYLGTTRNWYVSSPVVSTASSETNMLRYYEYIEAGNNNPIGQPTGSTAYWKGYNPNHTMVAGKGYIALPSATGGAVTFSGTMNSGNVSIPLSKSLAGYNLIGNPYPCHLAWTEAFVESITAPDGGTAPATLIDPTIWYRTNAGVVNSGGNAAWSFKTINVSTGEASPIETTNIIPPMQAFWVKAKVAGTLILTSDLLKSHQATNPLKAPAAKKTNRQRVRLEVSNGTTTDETLIYFDAAALNTYDRYDSPKYPESGTATQIFSTVGSEKLVINGMNSIVMDTPINLGFVSGNATAFSIRANELRNIPVGVKVILRDNATMAETDLTDGFSTYQFSPAVTNTDRFSLIFRSPGVSTSVDNTAKLDAQVYVNAANQITIIAPEKSTYSIYNAMGQKQHENSLASTKTTIDKAFGAGVYFVSLSVNGQSEIQKVIIR